MADPGRLSRKCGSYRTSELRQPGSFLTLRCTSISTVKILKSFVSVAAGAGDAVTDGDGAVDCVDDGGGAGAGAGAGAGDRGGGGAGAGAGDGAGAGAGDCVDGGGDAGACDAGVGGGVRRDFSANVVSFKSPSSSSSSGDPKPPSEFSSSNGTQDKSPARFSKSEMPTS